MADEWYYAHDATRIGPFSAFQLKKLATLGSILRTDTIWKVGVEKGVLASKVKNLFTLPSTGRQTPVISALNARECEQLRFNVLRGNGIDTIKHGWYHSFFSEPT